MMSAFDSFLVYLNTELAGTPAVHWVRQDPTSDQAHLLQENALNVSILAIEEDGSCEELLVSLDVIGSDERTVLGWIARIRDVLMQHQYAAESDYATDPEAPVSLSRLVSWHRDDIRFAMVMKDDRLVHLNATLPLQHVRQ